LSRKDREVLSFDSVRRYVDVRAGDPAGELSSRSHKDLADHEKIGKALLDRISQKGEEWGVKFHAFKLTDCSPTVETEQLALDEKDDGSD
jgi:hypothetical protein